LCRRRNVKKRRRYSSGWRRRDERFARAARLSGNFSNLETPRPERIILRRWSILDLGAIGSCYLPQSQLFPQLHSLLSFMGQFFPVFLQLGLSAANVTVQIAAVRTENRIFV